jgi:hypothetical protein
MDAKYPANLDPKLKEAYDRVMGTNGKSQKHAEHHDAPKMVTKQVRSDEPTIVHLGNEHPRTVAPGETTVAKPESHTSPVVMIILGIVGVLFFIAYAIFWGQMLGFKLIPSF